MATVLVQNRVNQATSSLPSEVTRLGVTTEKKSSSILMMIGLTSDNPDLYNNTYLTNYASLNIVDELKRIEGVEKSCLMAVVPTYNGKGVCMLDVGANALNTAVYSALAFAENFDWGNFGESLATGVNEFFENFDFKALAKTVNKWKLIQIKG